MRANFLYNLLPTNLVNRFSLFKRNDLSISGDYLTNRLPNEMNVHIFSFLKTKDISRLNRSNLGFYHLTKERLAREKAQLIRKQAKSLTELFSYGVDPNYYFDADDIFWDLNGILHTKGIAAMDIIDCAHKEFGLSVESVGDIYDKSQRLVDSLVIQDEPYLLEEYIKKYQPDLNRLNTKQETILDLAIGDRSAICIQILLQHGAKLRLGERDLLAGGRLKFHDYSDKTINIWREIVDLACAQGYDRATLLMHIEKDNQRFIENISDKLFPASPRFSF